MAERSKFKADVKSLNVMMIIQLILEEIVVLIVSALLLGMKVNKDFTMYFSLIIASCIVTYYLVKRYQKKFALKLSYKTDPNFNIQTYFKFMIMALGAAWLTSAVINYIMEMLSGIIIFETPDFSLKYDFTTNIVLYIYAIIVAPITEELLFRGIILGKLKEYGENYAIIIVSIIFGLFHGNLPQTIPTFIVSLFLCQVTLKSNSIVPAISIHMINNAIAQLADVNNSFFQIFLDIIIFGVIIAAIILLIKEYKNKKSYKIEFKIADYFKNWAGIIILILCVFSILESIIII